MSDSRQHEPTPSIPSKYELQVWESIQHYKGRPLSQAMQNAGERVAKGVTHLGKHAAKQLEKHPRAASAVSRGQEFVAKGASKAGAKARDAAEAMPEWGGTAVQSVRKTVGKVSRAGLSPKRVVALHNKRGHDIASLSDLRQLDLELVEKVRGRAANWYYPIAAAASGAGAGLAITGGQLAITASAGAAAAPSAGAIAGAFTADTAVVLGLSSRAVGQVALYYGYDPEEPSEKLFIMSVVNLGTASSAAAKNAAMADISKLTQALFRGKSWEVLSNAFVSKVAEKFAKAFGVRLTKKGLGKVVPAFGLVLGSTLNWATLEGIVDAAEMAYRRRFLLEKYPHLAAEAFATFTDPDDSDGAAESDERISVLDEIVDEGGPDLR
ncbi:EcsC family protein [Streptomyces griseoaurantiacus]|uniref:EcsC family protein n=1 Tax=Streptomyces griseoaurantiacus TaxID=68213 RepID=UPI00177B8E0A|nr:hypothetical protein GCM10018782_41520 [Streptomyces griseoaurantiacus]